MTTHERNRTTLSLSQLAQTMREQVFGGQTKEQQEQFIRAEKRARIFHAWNTVIGKSREKQHVTGLFYIPEKNELLVYVDEPVWAQEFSMLREILRARMAAIGADVAHISFKTSTHTNNSRRE
ncbi:DUF721 domain-containing protein [Collinsella sp. zg1085]|uniref:DciA family protein n=1 Tax=Collinsella sp. zg1085 TaxID=2844380 RepID=UPI001C0B0C5D|nr:DciA family protein [Collinsella sp. zg1085]QWT17606.1 DUF721 domain-containing protein [Collinsella sp. zg1085]